MRELLLKILNEYLKAKEYYQLPSVKCVLTRLQKALLK